VPDVPLFYFIDRGVNLTTYRHPVPCLRKLFFYINCDPLYFKKEQIYLPQRPITIIPSFIEKGKTNKNELYSCLKKRKLTVCKIQ